MFVVPRAVDVAPRPIERIMPVYPERALKERVRGGVTLKVLVSESGVPLTAQVEKGVRADIDRAAISAAMQWRFEPARKGGRAVRTFATVSFSFEAFSSRGHRFRWSPPRAPHRRRHPAPAGVESGQRFAGSPQSTWIAGGRVNVCRTTQYCSVFVRSAASWSGVAFGAFRSKRTRMS